jgi:hypothetical protein
MAVGLSLLSALASCAAATPAEQALLMHGELLDSLRVLFADNRAVYEAELARGVQEGAWTELEKEAALQKAQQVSAPGMGFPLGPRGEISAARRPAGGLAFGELGRWDPWSPMGLFEQWVEQRLTATGRFWSGALQGYAYAAMDRAEELWLAARTAEDLEEAALVLGKAKGFFGRSFDLATKYPASSGAIRSRPSPSSSFTGDAVNDLIDHLNVIACKEPLFLPDPDRDPKGYAAARITWTALESLRHRFTQRPAAARRFREDETRFLAGAARAERALDGAILSGTSAAEFEKLLQSLAQYEVPRGPLKGFPNTMEGVDRLDYHSLLRGSPRAGLSSNSPQKVEYYQTLLRWLQAQESGDEVALVAARRGVQEKLSRFPFGVAQQIEEMITRARPVAGATPPPIEPAAGGSAVEALVGSLAGIPRGANRNTSGAAALAAIWNQLRQGGSIHSLDDPEQCAQTWFQLAADPNQRHLFALRDRAAREVLATIGGSVPDSLEVPLVTTLRDQLEAAIAAKELDRAERILAISAAGGFLAREEQERDRSELQLIRKAAQFTAEGEAQSARKAYKNLLATTVSPAVAAVAVRAFKDTEPRAARPVAP